MFDDVGLLLAERRPSAPDPKLTLHGGSQVTAMQRFRPVAAADKSRPLTVSGLQPQPTARRKREASPPK